ncbi:hypothetical protein HDU82_008198 [Entophlyctis luteolus]|nr:hypothetical protein HDU82_008198 [Entophlyctis luteolus]
MGCAVSLRRAADAADASVAPEEVRAARAASLRARECADALLKWRRAFAGLVDAIEGTCYVAAIWAEDERDIPFSSAFKSLSLAATELAAASPTLLEALDAHAELLADLISRQREHHNAVQDAANQIAHFTAVCKKLAAILETPLSFSSMPRLGMISLARGTSVETLLLAPSRALAGPNGRPRNNEQFALGNRSTAADPEVIFTGDSTIDLAPRKRARAALDMALRGEQQKWNVYNTTCDERMYEAVARLLFAQGELWEKFAKVFARMLAICKQYAAAQIGNTNNSNKNPGTPLLDSVDGAASPWLQHRKSVTATANRALFVNPETDQKICKHRLIFIKRWHYLAEVSCKLWIDLRSCEIEFVESSFDWFEMDKQPHCIIRDSDCYGFDDGTELPDIAPKRLFLDLLDKWGDTLRSPLQPLSGGDMNLQKPFSVVKTCFQYAERTLLNVNEREKAALDLLKKLKKMSKMAKPSTTGAQPGSHKLEALQHKFDKSLVENRAFRRTKLMKSQTELWRGLESCTRFSSSVYLFLACQYKDKIVGIGQDETVDELVNSEPIANNSNVVLSTEERDNERSRNPLKQTVESDCPVPTQKSSGVMQISDLFFGVQRNFASRTKSLSRKVYPDSDATEAPEESGEFNGLSQQDECLLNSRSNLLRSRMGSIFSPDSFPKASDRSLTHQGSQDLLRPSPVAGPPQSSSNADLKLLSADEIKDASANITHEESVKEIKLHTNQSNTDKFEVMPDVTRLAPEPPTAADPSRIERKDSEMPSSLGIATEIASATGVAEEENHFGNITDAPPQYETVAQQIDQEAPVEKKRHKKKKHKDESSEKRRHRKKTASTAHSGDYTEGSDQGHRKHRRKKDKGPPPPPPINPALFHEGPEMIVSEINTPSVIVSSSARNSVYNVLPGTSKKFPF